MKYFVLGAVILAVLVVFSAVSGSCTAQALGEVISPLEQAQAAAQRGADEAARELSRHAAQAWFDALPRLERLLHHEEVDAISQGFARLEAAPAEELPALCAELAEQIRHLRSMDRLSVENLL